MSNSINLHIEENKEIVNISIEDVGLTENVNLDVSIEDVSVNLVIEDAGVPGRDGLGADEAALIIDRIDELEDNVGDTDFNFRNQINSFLSF